MVIEAQFKEVLPFSEGLAQVTLKDDASWGYVDKTGRLVWKSKSPE